MSTFFGSLMTIPSFHWSGTFPFPQILLKRLCNMLTVLPVCFDGFWWYLVWPCSLPVSQTHGSFLDLCLWGFVVINGQFCLSWYHGRISVVRQGQVGSAAPWVVLPIAPTVPMLLSVPTPLVLHWLVCLLELSSQPFWLKGTLPSDTPNLLPLDVSLYFFVSGFISFLSPCLCCSCAAYVQRSFPFFPCFHLWMVLAEI